MEANQALVHTGSKRRAIIAVLWTCCLALLTVASAYVRFPIPGSSVPFTMQVYVVLVAGLVGGMTVGAASQMLYLALGAVGLPVFAVGAGLIGPTGGYLVGFMLAAMVTGAIVDKGRDTGVRLVTAALVGAAVIHLCGYAHLVLVWRLRPADAFFVGTLPFLPFDLAKAFLAAATAGSMRRWKPAGR